MLADPTLPSSASLHSQPTALTPKNRVLHEVKTLDFKRGTLGEGLVHIQLPSPSTKIDVRREGTKLVLSLHEVSLPDALHRRLDVLDFATPVQFVSTQRMNNKVQVLIEPTATSEWDFSTLRIDNVLTLIVSEVKPQEKARTSVFSSPKISLNFQNIEVRSVLQVIADFTKLNVVASDSVTGAMTLRLKDVPWEQALDIILQAKGLAQRRSGNVIWIAPKDEIANKEKLEFEALSALQGMEPVRTQSFPMNYAKASDIAQQLNTSSAVGNGAGRILSLRGSAFAEARTNQLFVTDIPNRLDQVQQLIKKLDVPVRQILIEARIVEASDTFGRSLGVKLGGADLQSARGGVGGTPIAGRGDIRVGIGSNYGNAVATTGLGGTTDLTAGFVNLPAVGQNGYGAASFALTLFSAATNQLMGLELSALEADGKGKVVSSPRVITADQVKALIEQGTELPYQIATSSGATSIAFRKANLKLEVTPQITPEGSVILDLDVTKDSVGQSTAAGFAINTKHIKTQVLVENGGTVVIGGIYEVSETNSETKVPFLGDIPIIGNLFKSRSKSSNKQELLVFITPKVVNEPLLSR